MKSISEFLYHNYYQLNSLNANKYLHKHLKEITEIA